MTLWVRIVSLPLYFMEIFRGEARSLQCLDITIIYVTSTNNYVIINASTYVIQRKISNSIINKSRLCFDVREPVLE